MSPFWEGFGRPTSMIFAFFHVFFDVKIDEIFGKATKTEKHKVKACVYRQKHTLATKKLSSTHKTHTHTPRKHTP